MGIDGSTEEECIVWACPYIREVGDCKTFRAEKNSTILSRMHFICKDKGTLRSEAQEPQD